MILKEKKLRQYSILSVAISISACKTMLEKYIYSGEISEYQLINGGNVFRRAPIRD
jgi:hypothetical protein